MHSEFKQYMTKYINAICIVIALNFGTLSSAQSAVVINEIYYNAPDSLDDAGLDLDFIELFNTGVAPVDLSGASVTGVGFVFSEGTTIGPAQYLLVAQSISDATNTWGVIPIAEFESGGFSGKGELVELLDQNGIVIDYVEYDDNAPWPGSADGAGSSLELTNPNLDNSLAESWAASLNLNPTPGSPNSTLESSPAPKITGLRTIPSVLTSLAPFEILARVDQSIQAMDLYYVVGTEEFETGPVQMNALVGGEWSATLPGQPAGELIRYRLSTSGVDSPADSDTVNYHGLVVNDEVETQLPMLRFFISDDDYDGLYKTKFDNDEFPIVIEYGGQVIDNARIRVRGDTSRRQRKISYKVELPNGHLLDLGEYGLYPVDEFALQADRVDIPFVKAHVAWETVFAEGEPRIPSFKLRLQKNREFFGLYRLQGNYDGEFREFHSFGNKELYEAKIGGWRSFHSNRLTAFEQKNPKDGDYSEVLAANEVLRSKNTDARSAWVYRNVDIPAMVNYAAISALMHHADQQAKNYYITRDADTGRWSQLFWDLNITWHGVAFGSCPKNRMTEPTCIKNRLLDAVWDTPLVQQMYWRRIQTLTDHYLADGYLEGRRADIISVISPEEGELDAQAWGGGNSLWRRNFVTDPFNKFRWDKSIADRRVAFAGESRMPGRIPSKPMLIINEIQYNPGSFYTSEFIELYNPNEFAVDMSAWEMSGVGFTFRHGTVLPSDSYMVIVKQDAAFKEQYEGNIFVAGQYDGKLSNGGEVLELIDNVGSVIDTVEYMSSSPWSAQADGTGYTLSLLQPDLDNKNAANWLLSEVVGGTPGASNNDFVVQVKPTLEFDAQQFLENDIGIQNVSVSVELSQPYVSELVYNYELVAGTASLGAVDELDTDVVDSSGQIVFAAGSNSALIDVSLLGDLLEEPNETFSFAFSGVDGSLVGNNIADVTIIDNDTELALGLVLDVNGTPVSLAIESFSNQDRGPGQASILNGGSTLLMEGNIWKQVLLDYSVTKDTVLEFDFSGVREGEYHSIGLETNNFGSSGLVFQLWGSKTYGNQSHKNYQSGSVHYEIPVGQILRHREYSALVFISNHDRIPKDASSKFSNIKIYEATN